MSMHVKHALCKYILCRSMYLLLRHVYITYKSLTEYNTRFGILWTSLIVTYNLWIKTKARGAVFEVLKFLSSEFLKHGEVFDFSDFSTEERIFYFFQSLFSDFSTDDRMMIHPEKKKKVPVPPLNAHYESHCADISYKSTSM